MMKEVLLLGLVACTVACAQTVRSRPLAGMADFEEPITKIAVAPFRATGRLAVQSEQVQLAQRQSAGSPEMVIQLVSRYVTEALGERGPEVIPADDMARALGVPNPADTRLSPIEVAERASSEFGADAVLIGEVSRFVEREGGAAGATRPASVGFRVVLYLAPRGQPVWEGAFDETQLALGDHILNAGRYPGAGLRWLSGDEMARWGATEVAEAVPLAP